MHPQAENDSNWKADATLGTAGRVAACEPIPENAQSYSIPEVNVRRLLRKCEDMNDSGDYESWRFERYVEALEQLLYAFKATLDKAKRDELLVDRLSSYEKRVTVLKNVAHPEVNLVENSYRSLLLGNDEVQQKEQHPSSAPPGPASVNPTFAGKRDESMIPSDISLSDAPSISSEKKSHVSSTRPNLDAQREELLNQNPRTSGKDLDVVVAAELDRQEHITEEMLYLTQSLKENMMTANQLIKRDFKVIDKATTVADRNAVRLGRENEKLAEQNKKNTSWWVLLALVGLFAIFIMMVLFMRLFPKPRAYRNL